MKDYFSDSEKANISIIKDYLSQYIRTSRYAESIAYTQHNDDEECVNILEAIIHCDGFTCSIVYHIDTISDNKMYLELFYDGCDYHFTIYDIFNLYDIHNFKVYEFENCVEEKSITNALQELINLIETYSVEMKKAGANKALAELIRNRKQDTQILFNNHADYDDYIEGDYACVLKYSNMPKEKAIKKLKAKQNNNRLTVYEKRLLSYLSAGYEIAERKKSSGGLNYKSAKKVVLSVISVVSSIVVMTAYFLLKFKIFGTNAVVLYFDSKTDILPDYIFFILISLAAFAAFLAFVIGTPFAVALCSDEDKEIAKAKFNGVLRYDHKIFNIIAPIIALIISIVAIYSTTQAVGLNDKQIVIHDHHSISINYDDLTIYQVQRWSDENGGTIYTDADEYYYVIVYENNQYYEMPIMRTDEYEGKTFTEQLIKHNVKIIKVKWFKDIPGIKSE